MLVSRLPIHKIYNEIGGWLRKVPKCNLKDSLMLFSLFTRSHESAF